MWQSVSIIKRYNRYTMINFTDFPEKPIDLIISDLKWKCLIRAILKAKNIMLVGPSGCAKTTAAFASSLALNRSIERFNLGSTQDARAMLIGNTSYKKETGTVFNQSPFIKAIQKPNNIILLDEFSRGSHDAHNILMTVTDPIQRYIRLDEDFEDSIIKVAPGVCFIATANIGNQYTATKVLDKASIRRFPIKIEMELLTVDELEYLFSIKFPDVTSEQGKLLKLLSKIYGDILSQTKIEDSVLSSEISTASMMEIAEMVVDGFTLDEIANAAIYPEYSDDGGADSERSFVRAIVQKYTSNKIKSPINDPINTKNIKTF